MTDIKIIFEDGAEYHGKSFGYKGSAAGELVFNTAMTGYPEGLTDPSYKGQILVMTYPQVGNYGVPFNEKENGIPNFVRHRSEFCNKFCLFTHRHNYYVNLIHHVFITGYNLLCTCIY